eukprot:jgi/Bigna1/89388/estExt_fgenesh1_pg.C_480108
MSEAPKAEAAAAATVAAKSKDVAKSEAKDGAAMTQERPTVTVKDVKLVAGNTAIFSGEDIAIIVANPEIESREEIAQMNKNFLKNRLKKKTKKQDTEEQKAGPLHKGKVSKWFGEKGYGFLNAEGIKDDIFVHWKSIIQKGKKSLNIGDTVVFEKHENDKGKPVGKLVRVMSKYHLSYIQPLSFAETKAGSLSEKHSNIELFEHPDAEKRKVAPFKARVKGGADIGRVQRFAGDLMFLLLNRRKVAFEGLPCKKYDDFGLLAKDVSDIKKGVFNAKMRARFVVEQVLPGVSEASTQFNMKRDAEIQKKQLEKLHGIKQKLLAYLGKTKESSRRMNSRPGMFGFIKFNDLLRDMPEVIEFLNANKIRLTSAKKRKRDSVEPAAADTAEKKDEGGEKKEAEERKEAAASTSTANKESDMKVDGATLATKESAGEQQTGTEPSPKKAKTT